PGAVGRQVVEVGRRDELGARPGVHVDELREVELDAELLRGAANLLDARRHGHRHLPSLRRRQIVPNVTRWSAGVQWRLPTHARAAECRPRALAEYDAHMGAAAGHAGESRILSEIISTVGSSLELDEVLAGVVRLLSEASAVHACFVYLVEGGGERMVLRSASEPYAGLVGEIALERGEGLAWWAAEHREPAFIRENALSDPRTKYVPELEEEQFQSLISVPILARVGEAIGVISLHTEAPREFSEDEVDFLVSSASLVAGAIENARLYADMRRRVEELEGLTRLGDTIVRADAVDE